MGLLQRLKCLRCCHQANCALMRAVLKKHEEWVKSERIELRALLDEAIEFAKSPN